MAIKAEASPFLEVETLVKQLKALLDLKDEQLVENEMLLLMGNRFHITVYHPFRPLRVRLPPLHGIPTRTVQRLTGSPPLPRTVHQGLVRKFKDHVTRKGAKAAARSRQPQCSCTSMLVLTVRAALVYAAWYD